MRVNEIYASVQGEGIYTGVPTIFVRLQGCNLDCCWCDTKYAQSSSEGTELSVFDVLDGVLDMGVCQQNQPKWVCITGGEPLLQARELRELVEGLRCAEFFVEIETNGSQLPPEWWWMVNSWVADVKCPSSGMESVCAAEWLTLGEGHQVKFVVADSADLRFVESVLDSVKESFGRPSETEVLISPMLGSKWDVDDPWPSEVAEFCRDHGLRYSLQIHKLLWGSERAR